MKKPINWTITLFITLTPVAAILGTAWIAYTNAWHAKTIVLSLIFLFTTGLSITAGYHRLFSHKAYKAVWPIKLLYVLIGSACFEGSVLEWCTDHRNHHRYVDKEKDPYSITKSFWHAHMGWLFHLEPKKRNYKNVEDLSAQALLRWQDRYFVPLALFMCFGLPTLIASTWGDAFGGFMLAGMLRLVVNQQLTFCINSVCHYFGKQTYSDTHTAKDNWVTSLFTYGEGFHNFHHQFSIDYRNGIKFYHFDPSKWFIKLLSMCGLASNLRKVNTALIIRAKIRMDEKRLLKKASLSDSVLAYAQQVITPVREHINELLSNIDELNTNYQQLKSEHIKNVQQKTLEYKQKLKAAQSELHESLKSWKRLVRDTEWLVLQPQKI